MQRKEAQESLVAFCRYTFPGYIESGICYQIAEPLERVERGELKRLIVVAPPRHSKSEHISRRFPAWYLGRNPQKQVIACAYSDEKANGNSLAVREIIKEKRFQNLWPLGFTTENVQRWQFTGKENKNPNYLSSGVGGGITGEGADVFIIDDPIKNREEAESKITREKIWDWYTSTAYTRLQPDAAFIITMARWHKDDLIGRLQKLSKEDPLADKWEIVHLKAISKDEDGNEIALWPEMFTIKDLHRIRANNDKDFASLYQGDPVIAEGEIFKRDDLVYYKELPNISNKIMFWDTAFKAKEANDYSAGVLLGVAENGYYILDVVYKRFEYPELKRMIQALYDRDKPHAVLVEDQASGQSIVQELQRETRIPILPTKSDRDKIARAHSVTPLFEAHKVFLPESAPWLYDFTEQLCGFPHEKFDDMVDACVGALNYARNISLTQAPIVGKFG